MSYRPLPAKLLATLTLKKKTENCKWWRDHAPYTRWKIGMEWTLHRQLLRGAGGCGREGELGTLNFRRPGMPFWNGSRERPGHHSSCIRRGFATQDGSHSFHRDLWVSYKTHVQGGGEMNMMKIKVTRYLMFRSILRVLSYSRILPFQPLVPLLLSWEV